MFGSCRLLLAGALPAFALAPGHALAQEELPAFVFRDVTDGRGILPRLAPPNMGVGINAIDYDMDGDVDLFAPAAGPDQLYRSNGRVFEEVAAEVGLADPTANRVALWFDADGDHDYDVITGNDDANATSSYRFYVQEKPERFADHTTSAGFLIAETFIDGLSANQIQNRGGMAAGDIDLDGDLDLYVANWKTRSRMFQNNGNATFADVSQSSGVWSIPVDQMSQWQAMMIDLTRDGYPEIHVAVDFKENLLFHNQGNGTFVDIAQSIGLGNLMNDMGMAVGDFDEDGDFDFYTTNIDAHVGWNTLFRNDSTGTNSLSFTEIAPQVGCQDGYWGWGADFMDGDLDGHLDIIATNGWWTDSTLGDWTIDPSRYYRHLGFGPDGDFLGFEEIGGTVGFDDTFWGSGLMPFDQDRDGDLDVLQARMDGGLRLLENVNKAITADGQARNYLVVQPRMSGANHLAVGAVVRIDVGGRKQLRYISAGSSFLSQAPAEAHFGVDTVTVIDEVRVWFPDGTTKFRKNVPVNQVLRIDG